MKEKQGLITERLKLIDIYPDRAQELAEKYKKEPEELELVRKGKVSDRVEVKENERAVVNYITTNEVDRDKEIVESSGVNLKNYRENPIVLWAHNYHGIPIGKNLWVKNDEKGLRAKTRFLDHDAADEIYKLYTESIMDGKKDTGPALKAWSIGFIPLEWQDYNDKDSKKNNGAKRKYTKWELLEYSAVPIPSNPQALTVAIGKGLKLSPQLKEELGIEIVKKPEETDSQIRLPVSGEEDKHNGHDIKTMTVSEKKGIQVLYCMDCKKIITYLFNKEKGWIMEEAKKWMSEHGKSINIAFEQFKNEEIETIEMLIQKYVDEKEIELEGEEDTKKKKDISDDGLVDDLVSKPYANEHSCRLNPPDKYDRFARKNCGQKHDGKCIDVIYGVKEGKSEIQALRYKKDIWTESAAKNHCKSRKGTFEPAKQEEYTEEQQKMSQELRERVEELIHEVRGEKEGRVLSGKNRKLVKQCADMLVELYNATEPPQREEYEIEIDEGSQGKEEKIEVSDEMISKAVEEKLKSLKGDNDSLLKLSKEVAILTDVIAKLTGRVIER